MSLTFSLVRVAVTERCYFPLSVESIVHIVIYVRNKESSVRRYGLF